MVYVEQPELHLHPALQVEIGDLLCAYAPSVTGWLVEDEKPSRDTSKQFLFETHSEYLLLRLLRRIRETTNGVIDDKDLVLYPDDVSVIYIDNRHGLSTSKQLRIDEDGDFIDEWPRGFFEESYDEKFRGR